MKNFLANSALLAVMALGLSFTSCNKKAQDKEQKTNETAVAAKDSTATVDADGKLKAHQEDIQALWDDIFGDEKKMAKYTTAGKFVFLTAEDGKQGLLLYFYKDQKEVDNFDGIDVELGQQVAFQGDAVVIKEKVEASDMTTYYGVTEDEGFSELFTVTEKDGKKSYTNDMDEPFDEKEALSFIEKFNQEKAVPLADTLGEWNKL